MSLQACQLWPDNPQVSLRLRRFDSGVLVVQFKTRDEDKARVLPGRSLARGAACADVHGGLITLPVIGAAQGTHGIPAAPA